MSTSRNKSELASLLQHITLEFESAQRGLSGLAQGTVQHQVMTAHVNRVGGYREQLATLVGEVEATSTIGALYTIIMEEKETPTLQEQRP